MVFTCYSQDIHFSQYSNAPLNINPALTGEFQGRGRFILNYRNQWQSITNNPYRTYAFSSDCAFFKDKFAAGLLIFNDVAGDANMMNTQIKLSMATKVRVAKTDYFKIGIQAAYSQNKVTSSLLTWNNQFDGNALNTNIASNEVLSYENNHFFDFAAGALWTHLVDKQKVFSVGFSAFHITQPKDNFSSNNSNLNIRWCAHADAFIHTSSQNISVYPSLLLTKQGSFSEFNIGGMIKYNKGDNSKYTGVVKSSSVYIGIFYRYNDAIILCSRLNIKKTIDICFSYDVNVSKLNIASNLRGGSEISLLYTIPEGHLINLK